MANYALIENDSVTELYDLYPKNWRNISNFFALENETEFLHSLGWRTIVKTTPTYNVDTQRLGNPIYTIENDTVYESREVIDLPIAPAAPVYTQEQIEQQLLTQHNQALDALRIKRDKLLQETDYTQLNDVIILNGPELTAEYQTYRQQLRDLPAQYENDLSFIDESTIIYPTLPGVV